VAAPRIGFFRRRAAAPWREHALTCVAQVWTLTTWLAPRSQEPGVDALVEGIKRHLEDAKRAAEGHPERPGRLARLLSSVGGIPVERVMSNLDAAEADLLRLAPNDYLRGQMPSLLANVRRHLPGDDPQRVRIEEIARRARESGVQDTDRGCVVAAVQGANAAARDEIMRVRSFLNVLMVSASVLALAVVGIAVFGAIKPDAIPLCFTPGNENVVCPTKANPIAGKPVDKVLAITASPWDLVLVEAIGLIAAALAAAASLRDIKGTETPYGLPVALAVLKLPTGALTAFLGLLLMRGQFVPGLSALDFPAQIAAWAVVFGYAQQLFTRFVDQRAHAVLNDVGGSVDKREAG
jgi:hypothetical protein